MVPFTKRHLVALLSIVIFTGFTLFTALPSKKAAPRYSPTDDEPGKQGVKADLYNSRRQLVEGVCKSHPQLASQPIQWHYAFYVSQFHATYWYLPKVASTNTIRYLTKLSKPDIDPKRLKLGPYDHPEAFRRFVGEYRFVHPVSDEKALLGYFQKTYPKFLFVRNPLDRLLSAWNDKLNPHSSNKIFDRTASHIVAEFRNKTTNSNTQDPSLFEYFLFLDRGFDKVEMMNEHWRPMYQLCTPCAISFDFIGKFETFAEEIEFIAKQLRPKPTTSLAFGFGKAMFNNPVHRIKLLRTVPRVLVERVLKRYQLDYDFFGYNVTEDVERIYRQ